MLRVRNAVTERVCRALIRWRLRHDARHGSSELGATGWDAIPPQVMDVTTGSQPLLLELDLTNRERQSALTDTSRRNCASVDPTPAPKR